MRIPTAAPKGIPINAPFLKPSIVDPKFRQMVLQYLLGLGSAVNAAPTRPIPMPLAATPIVLATSSNR